MMGDTDIDLLEIENECYESGIKTLCGVDEAGRGPLAGPVFAAAVILPRNLVISGLNDSKKLSEKKRETLFEVIRAEALAIGVGTASEEEIDRVNILNATYLAMNRAISGLNFIVELSLVDGNRADGLLYPCRCIVGGDGKCASIATASIIAKVSRDRYMYNLHKTYPEYRFDRHKGYPTALHYELLREHGISPVHRKSFLKKWNAGVVTDEYKA